MAVGDVNDDGIGDLIVGLAGGPYFDMVYVLYGRTDWPASISFETEEPDVKVFQGRLWGSRLGAALAAGDVNGDGVDDLIMGAPVGSAAQPRGAVYVIHGAPSLPSEIDILATPADFTVTGDLARRHDIGAALARGDWSGDGLNDLVIGVAGGSSSPGGQVTAGETYLIFGGWGLPERIDLSETPADLSVWGDDVGDRMGGAVAIGDLDGDGTDDLIIGAPEYDWERRDLEGEVGDTVLVEFTMPNLPADSVVVLHNAWMMYWVP